MSKIQTICWWFMLVVSLIISTYQLITTGTTDSVHLLTSLIAMAVLDITRTKPTNKPVIAYKRGSLDMSNKDKLLAGESFEFNGSSSDIIRLT